MSFDSILRSHFADAAHWHGRHGHAADGIRDIGVDEWRSYYTFGFVRNPWDRLVSWYSMIEKRRKKLSFFRRRRRDPFEFKLWNEVVEKATDFDSFIDTCTDVIFDNGCYKSFAFNQIDYLADAAGRPIVDFVGRFETLEADAAEIFRRLGIRDVELPRRNPSSHSHYSEWYNDRTREIVAKRFARDISTFGYSFDRPDPG